jgi:hypothetical protein
VLAASPDLCVSVELGLGFPINLAVFRPNLVSLIILQQKKPKCYRRESGFGPPRRARPSCIPFLPLRPPPPRGHQLLPKPYAPPAAAPVLHPESPTMAVVRIRIGAGGAPSDLVTSQSNPSNHGVVASVAIHQDRSPPPSSLLP